MESRLLTKALKLLLHKKKIRQYELASLLGCPPTTLNRWLIGKHHISKSWISVIENHPQLGKEIADISRELIK